MYFETLFSGDEFRRKILAIAAPFAWLSTVDENASRYRHVKSRMSFLFLGVRNLSLTLRGLFCCHLYR